MREFSATKTSILLENSMISKTRHIFFSPRLTDKFLASKFPCLLLLVNTVLWLLNDAVLPAGLV